METFTKIVLFVCWAFFLGTTTILAKTPAGDQFLFISNITCTRDRQCSYCKNVTLSSGSNNGSSNGYGNSNGYLNSNGYGYTNTGNNPTPAPSPPVDISGNCTALGTYRNMCIFCRLPSIFGNPCGTGYCACGASAFDTEDCGLSCLTTYTLDVSKFGSC